MYDKYEIKTFSESMPIEISDIEIEKKNSALDDSINNKTDSEQKSKLKTTFQPKLFLSKQNNNISFFQSNSKNNYRNSIDNKNTNPMIIKKNLLNKSSTGQYSTQNFGEEAFSYNYTALNKNNNEKKEIQNTQRINLNELGTKYRKPIRTIKSYKNQFNIQKGANLEMISKKPIEYDSDINLNANKERPIIFPVYEKQEVEDIFIPSKKKHSRHPSIQKDDLQNKYQSCTLKYQSFFGSFNCSKNPRLVKSTSKIKINQLNDFNIEKLIEIGDKYANLRKPVLPLGKIMNNNIINNNIIRLKNKKKIPINSKTNNNFCYEGHTVSNFIRYTKKRINKDLKEDNNESAPIINTDRKREPKKIISTNIKQNSSTNHDGNKKVSQVINTSMKILNFDDEINNKDDCTTLKIIKRHLRKNSKELHIQKNHNKGDKSNENKNNLEMSQNIQQKKKINLNLNQKKNSINTKDSQKIKTNKMNYLRNEKQINKKILLESKLLTNDEKNYRNRIANRRQFIQNNEKLVTENQIYKNNNKVHSRMYYNEINPKNYYGYDERHNLENTIDNHSYFESVHSKKKSCNLEIEKMI